jgi:outer membrane receptor protein involved in Fe transport
MGNLGIRDIKIVQRLTTGMLLASTMLTCATSAYAQQKSVGTSPREIVVTAQKRSENLQNVPLSIQALTTEKLTELNVSNFSDYAKFLPSVSFQTLAPGQTSVYMRGVASGENGNHSASLPSVGIYLDEQPVTTILGALDVHVYDIARIEALAGPQGTLYGASSQAGTIRIITNKPDPGKYSAAFDVALNTVDHGGIGHGAQGYVNIPLSEKAAIRLVGWTQHDAGYIDNVHGQRTFPTSGETDDNANLAKNNFNDVDTYGGRAALKVDLDDRWTVTPSVMAQSAYANGVFAYDPSVGDLQVKHYNDDWSKDRWIQVALTLEGKISNLDFVYAGAMMDRKLSQHADYSDYSYWYDQPGYSYGGSWYDNSFVPINPSQYIWGKEHFGKQSHEVRLSSPQDERFRWIVGAFYQRQTNAIEQRYIINNLNDGLEVPFWPDTIWLTEQRRIDRDRAIFGEASYDLWKPLTVTAGVRFYKAHNTLAGFFGFNFLDLTDPLDTGYSTNTDYQCFSPVRILGGPCTNLDKGVSESGHTQKLNLTYHIDDSRMIYATWSTGFRPGGINRRGSQPPYQSDTLTNYELGWKTSWMDDRLTLNGALFKEVWKDVQISFLGTNGLTNIRNAGQATIKGIESNIDWAVDEYLTISGGATYLSAKIDQNFCQDLVGGVIVTDCASPAAPAGTELPVTPRLKSNVTARWEFPWLNGTGHFQASYVYQGAVWPELRIEERGILGRQKAYGTIDLSYGLDAGNTSYELFLTNAFDERGDVYRYTECYIQVCGVHQTYIVPTHPRTLGLRIGKTY